MKEITKDEGDSMTGERASMEDERSKKNDREHGRRKRLRGKRQHDGKKIDSMVDERESEV